MDVLVEFKGRATFGGYFGFKDYLEELLGRPIQNPPARYSGVDLNALKDLPGIKTVAELQHVHRQWVYALVRPGRTA